MCPLLYLTELSPMCGLMNGGPAVLRGAGYLGFYETYIFFYRSQVVLARMRKSPAHTRRELIDANSQLISPSCLMLVRVP